MLGTKQLIDSQAWKKASGHGHCPTSFSVLTVKNLIVSVILSGTNSIKSHFCQFSQQILYCSSKDSRFLRF